MSGRPGLITHSTVRVSTKCGCRYRESPFDGAFSPTTSWLALPDAMARGSPSPANGSGRSRMHSARVLGTSAIP